MDKLYSDVTFSINAPAVTVWRVLTSPEFTSQWVADFQPEFVSLESDWQIGSPVFWRRLDKLLVDGKVTISDPPHKLAFTVHDVSGNFDQVQSDEDGILCELSENDDVTTLRIKQGDFAKVPNGEKFCKMTGESWSRALPAIKRLAELKP